ncbi:C40 family peptidase [Nocardioides montaniterrae]
MLNGRNRITAGLAALALSGAATLTVTSIQSAHADPDINKVRDRVEALDHVAETAAEKYNTINVQLGQLHRELKSLQADQAREGSTLDGVRSDVRDSVIAQYQGETLGSAGSLLNTKPEAFLGQVSTVTTVNDLQNNLLADYGAQVKAYSIRQAQTQDRIDKIAALRKELAANKKTADENFAKAKDVLDGLEAKQREAILGGGPIDPGAISASGRAAAAVQYAMAQVGKAYVWGAAGPSAFDCSGLTMAAWARAGVSLPHSSSAQFGMGPHIPESELRPGDLVFYYSPISHVGMYIGNGLIVNAENPSVGVKVTSLHAMPYVGAVRPG